MYQYRKESIKHKNKLRQEKSRYSSFLVLLCMVFLVFFMRICYVLKENNEVKYDKRDDIVVTKKEVAETIDINKDDKVENTSIFNINEDSETYGTLLVYIVRENETINSIITKYNTTIEELEKYNDLKDLSIGTKLIIPLVNE